MKRLLIIISLLYIFNIQLCQTQEKDPYESEFHNNGGDLFPRDTYVNDYKVYDKSDIIGLPKSDITKFIKINRENGFGINGNYRFYDDSKLYDKKGYYTGVFTYSVSSDNLIYHFTSYIGGGRLIYNYSKKIVYIKSPSNSPVLQTTVKYFKGQFNGEFVVLNQDSLPLYQTEFRHGKGYWKDYYYLPKTNTYQLKEEGAVEQSYKVGTWKYYTEEGELEQEKVYQLKDSVDNRFPHCLFNKTEPCMEKESEAERLEYLKSVKHFKYR